MCTCVDGIDVVQSTCEDQPVFCTDCLTGLGYELKRLEAHIAKLEMAMDRLGRKPWEDAYRDHLANAIGNAKDRVELLQRKRRAVRDRDLGEARLAEQGQWAARVLARKHMMTYAELAAWFEHDLDEVTDEPTRARLEAIAQGARALA